MAAPAGNGLQDAGAALGELEKLASAAAVAIPTGGAGLFDEVPLAPAVQGLAGAGQAGRALKLATSALGHRTRMRQRLLKIGPEALADHEVLEMVLFLALPRRDTKPLARALLDRFGSYSGAIAAPADEIAAIEGMGEAAAAALKIVQAAALRLARAEVMARPVLSNWTALIDYLTAVMARERIEQFRIVFLDNKNRVLADEAQARGTVNHTPVYPREVVKRALELHATGLILSHNHPSGDPTPSEDDIVMTARIAKACETVAVRLHDHVIIGNGKWLSFRQQGLL